MMEELKPRAERLLERCRSQGLKIVTAESCTGGLVAAILTSIGGSSDVVDCGFVTYSNESKQKLLGVPADILGTHGAVSRECAMAMAAGALDHSSANIAVSVTGIAGPNGGSLEKPVGLVHFACGTRYSITHRERRFGDVGREGIRLAAVGIALEMLEAQLP
jgi:nicotinamide-nucleotide amidase